MQIRRTANAGVLLRLDGAEFLLDGVCGSVPPYLQTPQSERTALLERPPRAVAFTHMHDDHYDARFAADYLKISAGPIMGPADIQGSCSAPIRIGDVKITSIPTRHLGKSDGAAHISYIIEGSRCVWFTGDAAPQQLLTFHELPHPDVLIAPFAFAIAGGWSVTKQLAPDALVLLHMPPRTLDPAGLWHLVSDTVQQGSDFRVYIPEEIGNVIILPD